jgi:hypothetical protein
MIDWHQLNSFKRGPHAIDPDFPAERLMEYVRLNYPTEDARLAWHTVFPPLPETPIEVLQKIYDDEHGEPDFDNAASVRQ